MNEGFWRLDPAHDEEAQMSEGTDFAQRARTLLSQLDPKFSHVVVEFGPVLTAAEPKDVRPDMAVCGFA